jgi:hypothetical protein
VLDECCLGAVCVEEATVYARRFVLLGWLLALHSFTEFLGGNISYRFCRTYPGRVMNDAFFGCAVKFAITASFGIALKGNVSRGVWSHRRWEYRL